MAECRSMTGSDCDVEDIQLMMWEHPSPEQWLGLNHRDSLINIERQGGIYILELFSRSQDHYTIVPLYYIDTYAI